jgi:hypothetical protein
VLLSFFVAPWSNAACFRTGDHFREEREDMNRTTIAAAVFVAAASMSALAAPTIYAANAGTTSSTLHASNRELNGLGFAGTTSTMSGSDFLRWNNGTLTNNAGTFGWTDLVPRDVNSANVYTGNPDRADGSTPLPAEAAKKGTMKDVFGSFNS